METAARTAGSDGDEPGEVPMTRHGTVESSVAGGKPSATGPHASVVAIEADRVATSPAPGRQRRTKAQRSGLTASIAALPDDGRAIDDISRNSKSP